MRSRRAVVIGGSGFVGRRLVSMLAGDAEHPARPAEWPSFDAIHVLDRVPYEGAVGTVTAQVGDVCSRDDLRRALRGAHTVFHLASIVHVGLRKSPAIDRVNVDGVRHVVEICQELGVPFLVYTSSEDVVLGRVPVVRGDESIPYPSDVVHDYVRTKIEGEKIARAADGAGGLRTCSIRPVHVYGPRDPHAIKASLRAFASGAVPFLLGDGTARFDIVYVDNVVHAHLLAARRLHDEATRDVVGGQAYFVGEDNAPNYFEFIRPYAEAKRVAMPRRRLSHRSTALAARLMELVHRVTGREVPFHRFHLYVLAQDFFFTNERAARELGYRPIVSPEEGLRRTLAWLEAEPLD
ncbi:MAG: NAD-dependent epimerase/dehydratase family protein [Myxococcota bacterium]|nr:NAD-dependent epimerase/dehydratase family protein [Myxococcota bacterium]